MPDVFSPNVLTLVEQLVLGNLPGDGLARRDVTCESYSGMRTGDVIVDFGAHVGYFSARAAEEIGPEGQLVAVEPDARNVVCLQRRLADTTRIYAAAGWSGTGLIGLNTCDWCSAGHSCLFPRYGIGDVLGSVQHVPAVTLDMIAATLPRVDVVKIDAEGAELEIIKGGSATISKHNPLLLIEVDMNSDDLYDILTGLHYGVYGAVRVVDRQERILSAAVPPNGMWRCIPGDA